ncbi:MAG: hypothetical protein M9962_03545 [Oligoflexia bacterium]|nr:hypothetical protein [Oligoflexia bacterium]
MRIFSLLALLLAIPMLQGCEVSYTYGHVDYGHGHRRGWHRPYHPGPYYPGPHQPRWRDGRGPRHPGHGPRHPGWRGPRAEFDTLELAVDASTKTVRNSDAAEMLARDYSIKVSSAQKFLDLAEASNKAPAAKALGLNEKDISTLNKLEMPNRAVLNKVAKKLGERRTRVERVVRDFISDVKAQQ